MKRFLGVLLTILTLWLLTGVVLADPNDAEGSKDPPLFNRMPGYYIYRCDDIDFDSFEFKISSEKTKTVEGHHYYLIYYPNDGIKQPSPLQIGRNYLNAIKEIGGQLIYEFHDPDEDIVMKVVKNDTETWAYVRASANGSYEIHIIQKKTMNQDVVADAKSLASSIRDTGKAAVYGIYFDSGKAVIKPESEPTLKEIAKLLQMEPKLKLYVVGHTDNVGAFEYNLKLSKDRADAVVKSLVEKSNIASSRLQPFGAGPVAPVASNQTEDGRAKNRRVELVAQ